MKRLTDLTDYVSMLPSAREICGVHNWGKRATGWPLGMAASLLRQ
jgi:hypothetical protein